MIIGYGDRMLVLDMEVSITCEPEMLGEVGKALCEDNFIASYRSKVGQLVQPMVHLFTP